MTTNYSGAKTEMLQRFNSLWASKASTILGYAPKVYWPGIDDGELPDSSKFYVRLHFQTSVTNQSNLSESVVVHGSKRFTSYGVFVCEIYAPKRKESVKQSDQLCESILFIFRTSTNNVTMKNARIREMPSDNGAVRFNIITEFEYDEIS